jgi:hypothetical protein
LHAGARDLLDRVEQRAVVDAHGVSVLVLDQRAVHKAPRSRSARSCSSELVMRFATVAVSAGAISRTREQRAPSVTAGGEVQLVDGVQMTGWSQVR